MERRALIAVAISLFILVVYQGLLLPTLYPPKTILDQPGLATENSQGAPAPVGDNTAPPAEHVEAANVVADSMPAKQVTVETEHFIARLTTRGARLESFALKKYRTTLDSHSPPQELIVPAGDNELPIAVELRSAEGGDAVRVTALSDAAASYVLSDPKEAIVLSGDQSATVEFRWQGPAGTLQKAYTFRGDRADFSLRVRGENLAPQYRELGVSYLTGSKFGREALFDRAGYLRGRKFVETNLGSTSLKEGEIVPADPGFLWSAIAGRYFMASLVPLDAHNPRLWLKQRDTTIEQKVLLPLSEPNIDQQFDVYIGSKRIQTLETLGHNLNLALNMGWFGFIAVPLLWVLRHSHRVTGNYGVDIILLTVSLKVLFLPLTRKSFKSMQETQKLQPLMAEIRERLKDKPNDMNKEIMELYRTHGVNPLGGCLPMIVQIPVFIGLYQALLNAVELRHAPFFAWISDLSAPDRLGSIALPFVDPPGFPVLTLLMGGTMFAQQYMTPSTGDPTQRQMMMIMPVMFTFMFINLPAGLVLYWTINNMLTVAQQYYIRQSTA